ncbi:hypothetical protein ATEIFO6365_0006068900 [Aspergillus terreus]|uniref:Uncharacterized protein n=1 Tax=Aspergillus terreus TaxID=33178 RepID=A0A5M3YXM5_ASPTE|nr:hypothetical protein ATETN484_0005068900 [Aspergillus terreus]GFF17341.1 hypothetical protein ATEIFO6365_0006068900 [Aspergillus terreus]
MAEKASYLTSQAAKYALGVHRGPLDSEGHGAEHVEKADAVELETGQKTRAQKLRRHWGRFWCCYCFWSLIFLAIFLPIFFTLIIPAIAQRVVDDSTLLLVRADIMQPRPDSVVMTIESALDLPLSVPVRVDPIALELFNRDTKGNGTYAIVYINGTTVHGNTTLGVTNQYTPLNVEQWAKYVHSAVFMEHAPLSVRGKTTAYLGKLKNSITMNKNIPQTTLNKFSGFSIEDSTVILPPREDGTNLIANATLPNPSVMTLEIGTTVLDLKSGDLVIGNATIDNLVLRPGNHSAPVHGILDLHKIIENLGEVLRSQSNSLSQGYLSLDTVGKSVVYDGVEVPYYTDVMSQLTMTAKVPIADLLKNTLHELLGSNTTGLLSSLNITSDSPDLGSALSNIEANGGLSKVLNARGFGEFLGKEKRDAMVDMMGAFL